MLNGRNREIIDFAGRVSDVSKRMGYSAGLLLLFLLSLTSLPVEAQSNIQPAQPAFNLRRIYVSPEGAGTFDGSSWANAAKGSDLQMILRSTDTWNAINSTLQIWIAAGTYVPTEPLLPGDEQSASFTAVFAGKCSTISELWSMRGRTVSKRENTAMSIRATGRSRGR